MAHHSPEAFGSDDGQTEEFHNLMKQITKKRKEMNLGATGKYPEGQMNRNDFGEIRMAVASKPGKVIIDMGPDMGWIGMNPKQARDLAATIKRNADEAARA